MIRASSTKETSLPGYSPGMLFIFWVAGVAYAALCMRSWLGQPAPFGLVFNEMLSNLLHGRFDISPATIGNESIVYEGRSYAYFGIFCAFLRLPLLLSGTNNTDITSLSMLVAAAVSLACRLAAVATIFRKAGGTSAKPIFQLALIAAIITNGESIQFLAPSVHQEVVLWGSALASLFGLLLIRLVFGIARQNAVNYAAMALVAGLALICRVSFGFGSYATLTLIAAAQLLRARHDRPQLFRWVRRLLPAALILAAFAAVATGVNYARWGNALNFAPLQYQAIIDTMYPDRLPRLDRYGALNVQRIPFSLQYYFAPVWAITNDSGEFLLQSQQTRLFDDVEFPPGSLFLSDALIFLLAAIGLRTLTSRTHPATDTSLARLTVAGLAIPPILVLMAISLTHRYRMEFYPIMDFLAYIGIAEVARRDEPGVPKLALRILPVLSMMVAFLMLASSALLGSRPATDFKTERGWLGLLQDRLAGKNIFSERVIKEYQQTHPK